MTPPWQSSVCVAGERRYLCLAVAASHSSPYVCNRCFQDNKVFQTSWFILHPASHSPLCISVFKRLFAESLPPPRLYKDCIDIHLYLIKIPSNNNATVQDYQPSIFSEPRRPGLRGCSVTCLYNILFVLCDTSTPRLVMLFRLTEYSMVIMQIPFHGRREIYILYICVEK